MSGNILVYNYDNACLVGNVVTCYYCKYAVRHAPECIGDPGFDPSDIVCSYWGSDGLNQNDFCSRGKIGNYLKEDHSLEVSNYELDVHFMTEYLKEDYDVWKKTRWRK